MRNKNNLLALHITDQMCHALCEEWDSERYFFMVEALRWTVWLTHC